MVIFLLALGLERSWGQACSLPGMTPDNAIPVCGTAIFHQASVVNCTGPDVASTGCNVGVTSNSSFWYKFTCYTSGTLGFLIRGISNTDDYDWSLLDITGRNPNDVFNLSSLQVSLNLYGTPGNGSGAPFPNSPTGCRANATGDVHCNGDAVGNSPFNRMPNIIAGHQYLLMVTNWSQSTTGYDLSFTGGTANITDPLNPHLNYASVLCDSRQIRLKLNKKMTCKSLAANGTDFTLAIPGITVTAAQGIGCANGFDFDSVIITMSAPLPAGNYDVIMQDGTDGNTLEDYCGRKIPVGEKVPFTVAPPVPTPMDSLTKPGCAPNTLELVFKKPLQCASIAADGSDFTLSGPAAVSVTGAAGNCASGFTSSITVQLSAPLQLGGIYRLTLGIGSDGNTLLDECNLATPQGSFIDFDIKDTVNADFTYAIAYSCTQNAVQYNHNAANGINNWLWTFDSSTTSILQNPLITYTNFRQKHVQLVVTNGVCSDTAEQSVYFDNFMNASFEASNLVCPGDTASIKNTSEGNITGYSWTFGNGNTSILQDPQPQIYPVGAVTRNEVIRLVVTNSYGCFDSAVQRIKVINNCYIAVPSAFTPNGDGINDYLYPLNAYKALDLNFSVYNRFGQRLFFTRDWTNKWDGSFKGQGADPGTYVWVLSFINADTNTRVEQKGTVILIR